MVGSHELDLSPGWVAVVHYLCNRTLCTRTSSGKSGPKPSLCPIRSLLPWLKRTIGYCPADTGPSTYAQTNRIYSNSAVQRDGRFLFHRQEPLSTKGFIPVIPVIPLYP